MNGRQAKRIRRLSVTVAGKDAPESVLKPGSDRVLQIGGRFWKPSRKAKRRRGYVCQFLEDSLSYPRGSRAWTLGMLKRMFREDPKAFAEIERDHRNGGR